MTIPRHDFGLPTKSTKLFAVSHLGCVIIIMHWAHAVGADRPCAFLFSALCRSNACNHIHADLQWTLYGANWAEMSRTSLQRAQTLFQFNVMFITYLFFHSQVEHRKVMMNGVLEATLRKPQTMAFWHGFTVIPLLCSPNIILLALMLCCTLTATQTQQLPALQLTCATKGAFTLEVLVHTLDFLPVSEFLTACWHLFLKVTHIWYLCLHLLSTSNNLHAYKRVWLPKRK